MVRATLALISALALLPAASHGESSPGPVARYSIEGEFDAVKEDVRIAIENRGLVIQQTARINEMLERTGKDLGTAQQVFRDAEIYTFCSAVTSRLMMEADPHNIAYCPFVIAVYVAPKESKKVYVSFRRPEPSGGARSRKALRAVEDLLDGIVREALGLSK